MTWAGAVQLVVTVQYMFALKFSTTLQKMYLQNGLYNDDH